MSADLFAEFGNISRSSQSSHPPPPPPQLQWQQPTSTSQSGTGPSLPAKPQSDPFSFLNPNPKAFPSHQGQQVQQWPALSSQPQASSSIWGDMTSFGVYGNQNIVSRDPAEEEDGWGDFEVAPSISTTTAALPQNSIGGVQEIQAPVSNTQFPKRTRAGTIDLISNNLVDLSTPLNSSHDTEPKSAKPRNNDPNVLFDADDYDGETPLEEDDDEFGDFETTGAPAKPPANLPGPTSSGFGVAKAPAITRAQPPPSQLLSTLALGDSTTPSYPLAPKSPSFQDRNPFPGLALTTPTSAGFPKVETKPKEASPITAWPSIGNGDATKDGDGIDNWGAFEDFPPEKHENKSKSKIKPGWDWDAVDGVKPQPKPTATTKPLKVQAGKVQQPPSKSPSTWDWEATETSGDAVLPRQSADAMHPPMTDHNEDLPPPTNVPPPSILLSLFPALLDLADKALFLPVAGKPTIVRERVLTDPAAAEFLRAYLMLACVAGRIIAGRKLRWHRDKFIAQGMAISAAGAGGKGGMKLAGVDRTQSAREDREAADVAGMWRSHVVGRLRSAVAAVNSKSGGSAPLKVPELAEQMPVSTAKMVPTAARACVVCGLRRDERVAGVDTDIEDSFGEWWIDHWGHRACRNFWLGQEAKLRSR